MSEAREESDRRLLRARDAMDGSYAQPLDIAALARIALTSEAHFVRTFKKLAKALRVKPWHLIDWSASLTRAKG